MNGNHVRIIMGFSMLWCVNVICFFPDALAPWASTEWLRTYNTYALPAECLSLIAIAILAFKTPRRIGMASVAIGYIELFCGLCAPAILGNNAETPALAGVLCGMGLAPTMMFWFALLTEFTERHQAIVQGWQALAGECLFLGASIFFDAGVIPACVLTATSAICALRVDSSSLFSESGGAGSSAKSFLSLGSRFRHRSPLLYRLGGNQQTPRLRSRFRMGRSSICRCMPAVRQRNRVALFRLFPNNGTFALFAVHRPSFRHAARGHSVHSKRLRNITSAVFLRPLSPQHTRGCRRQRRCHTRIGMARLRNRRDGLHRSNVENKRLPH